MADKIYEISLWEDFYDTENGYYDERKLCVIGSDSMTDQCRAVEPKLVSNINGTHTFTFKMFYKYIEDFTGEKYDNPFINLLVNERKVKVFWEDEWYDLIIKNCQEDSSGKSITYTCKDLFVNELSKSGFNLEFSTDLGNNQGTIKELATKVLEGTDWQFDEGNTDDIYQRREGATYESIVGSNGLSDCVSVPISSEESISANAHILFFYDEIWQIFQGEIQSGAELQFAYAKEYKTDFNSSLVINAKNYKRSFEWNIVDSTINFSNNELSSINMNEISEYRAERYINLNKTIFDPLTKKYVDIYKATAAGTGNFENLISKDDIVYGFQTIQYNSVKNVPNLLVNNRDFQDVNGWSAGSDVSLNWQLYPKEKYTITETNLSSIEAYDSKKLIAKSTKAGAPVFYINLPENTIKVLTVQDAQGNILKRSDYDVDLTPGNIKQINFPGATKSKQYTIFYSEGKVREITLSNGPVYSIDSVKHGNDNYEFEFVWPRTVKIKNSSEATYDVEYLVGVLNSKSYLYMPASNSIFNDTFNCALSYFKDGISKGDSFIFRYNAMGDSSAAPSGEYITEFNGENKTLEVEIVDENNNSYSSMSDNYSLKNGYNELEITCAKSISYEDITNKKIKLKLTANRVIWLEEAEFFSKVMGIKIGGEGETILYPGDVDSSSVAQVYYKYYNHTKIEEQQITDPEKIEYLWNSTEDISADAKIEAEKIDYEKIRSIEVKESNRFNIIQSLAETFECWPVFTIEHDQETGKCLRDESGRARKYVKFVEEVGRQTGIGFVYGIDLNTIKRTVQSDKIVTKTIVPANSNQFGTNGFCTIARSTLNPNRSTYILNFDYYINNGLLDRDQVLEDINQLNNVLYANNIEIQAQSELLGTRKTELDQTRSDQTANNGVISSSESQIINLKAELLNKAQLTNYDSDEMNKWLGAHIEDEFVRDHLAAIANLTDKLNEARELEKPYEDKISFLELQIESFQKNIDELNEENSKAEAEFNIKYTNYIQEGTWKSDEYMDDNLYYLDAQSVAYTSSRPQVTYDISVYRLSRIEEFKAKKFYVGDIAYVEDTDFFGYLIDGITPYKELVMISELTSNFDEPEKDSFKVQNYKTQFEDLFQRIVASTQSLQFAQGNYARAASIVNPNGTIDTDVLQQTLNQNLNGFYDIYENIQINSEGIQVIDTSSRNNRVKITPGGIFITNDGGQIWQTALNSLGISTQLLTSGVIKTDKLMIMDGNQPAFRWDETGINAYYHNQDGAYNYNKFVRFDSFGIYGYDDGSKGLDPEAITFTPNNEEDVWHNENTRFALTWKGFLLKSDSKSIEISNENDIVVWSTNNRDEAVERVHLGEIEDNKFGLMLKNDSKVPTFYTNDDGNLWLSGSITIDAFGLENQNFTIAKLTVGPNNYEKIPLPVEPSEDFVINEDNFSDYIDVTQVPKDLQSGINFANFNWDGESNPKAVSFMSAITWEQDYDIYVKYKVNTAEGTNNSVRIGYLKNGTQVFNSRDNFIIYSDGSVYANNGTFKGEIIADRGKIGGWKISDGYLRSTGSLLTLDGNKEIISGKNFQIESDLSVFNNVSIKGTLHTMIFEADKVQVVGGSMFFKPGYRVEAQENGLNNKVTYYLADDYKGESPEPGGQTELIINFGKDNWKNIELDVLPTPGTTKDDFSFESTDDISDEYFNEFKNTFSYDVFTNTITVTSVRDWDYNHNIIVKYQSNNKNVYFHRVSDSVNFDGNTKNPIKELGNAGTLYHSLGRYVSYDKEKKALTLEVVGFEKQTVSVTVGENNHENVELPLETLLTTTTEDFDIEGGLDISTERLELIREKFEYNGDNTFSINGIKWEEKEEYELTFIYPVIIDSSLEKVGSLIELGSDGACIIGVNSSNSSSQYLESHGITMSTLQIGKNGQQVIGAPNLFLGDFKDVTGIDKLALLDGYGLYCDNVALRGSLTTFADGTYTGINSASDITIDTNNIFTQGKNVDPNDTIIIWGGAKDSLPTSIRLAPFQVTRKGLLYTQSAYIKNSVFVGGDIRAADLYTTNIYALPNQEGQENKPGITLHNLDVALSFTDDKIKMIGEESNYGIFYINNLGFMKYTYANNPNGSRYHNYYPFISMCSYDFDTKTFVSPFASGQWDESVRFDGGEFYGRKGSFETIDTISRRYKSGQIYMQINKNSIFSKLGENILSNISFEQDSESYGNYISLGDQESDISLLVSKTQTHIRTTENIINNKLTLNNGNFNLIYQPVTGGYDLYIGKS